MYVVTLPYQSHDVSAEVAEQELYLPARHIHLSLGYNTEQHLE